MSGISVEDWVITVDLGWGQISFDPLLRGSRKKFFASAVSGVVVYVTLLALGYGVVDAVLFAGIVGLGVDIGYPAKS